MPQKTLVVNHATATLEVLFSNLKRNYCSRIYKYNNISVEKQ